ncbi:excalibur calcium-binding domain-containing protein [Tateyamaria pelophila]|uniref:excalibur calcium-binding domain-containing protein n=1 Tax=Tateyamaria pelophila TaxID=328415 RepID=UPI001CBCD7C3|nr:excalibur calcium-binding domain-containing protein [Tateyamaria pelophila]
MLALGACAAQTPQNQSQVYSSLSTGPLWVEHSLTSSPLKLAFIEAELGSRGEQRSSSYPSNYLGEKTSSALGRKLYSREEASTTDLDCSSFSSSAAAQKAFLASGGPTRDPSGLDRDGDGLACEWGTYLKKSVASYQASLRPSRTYSPTRTTSRRSSSRCYVGPRGGTYTITASGNKNYGGC